MVENMHKGNAGEFEKPRLDKQKARREYLKTAKGINHSKKVIRKAIKRQLSYIRRNFKYIETLILQGNYYLLTEKQKEELETIKKLYTQQKYMIDNRTNSVENSIVNIAQPYVRPIVRGKANAKVEFGAKVAISIIGGYSFVDHLSWEAYNESEDLIVVIKRYRQTYGFYPEAVMVDKLYRNQKTLCFAILKE